MKLKLIDKCFILNCNNIKNKDDIRCNLQRPEQVQGGGQPAERRALHPREDAGREPPRRRRHAQQPRRALRQAGSAQHIITIFFNNLANEQAAA